MSTATRSDAAACEAARLLRTAATAIETHGWLQGEYWPEACNPYGPAGYVAGDPCCALGALAVAAGQYDADHVLYSLTTGRAVIEAVRAVAATLSGNAQIGQPPPRVATAVAEWNDAEGRAGAEVTAVLRRAADSLTVSNRPGGSSAKTSHRAGSPNHQTDSKEASAW